MNRLIKFYNQNRYIIWMAVLIIIAIIALIQILNNFALKRSGIKNNIDQNANSTNTINKNYSVITGKEIKEEVSQIIDEFINYCNNQEVEKAYGLLSEECIKTLYPTLEDFTQKYYEKLFINKKTYLYQSWISYDNKYTYKVDFLDDMLATGTASTSSIIDYYTVVKDNQNYKLNINKFIGITDINKTETKNNITIYVNRKKVFMDYETYEIEIKNNSEKEIMLDSLQDTDTVYVENDSKQQYYWTSHEILEEDITIKRAQGKKIDIKFNKEYKPSKEAKKIVFSEIMLNTLDSLKIEINLW